jgi:ferric-dicitrate binding protein FerR (iron transport regulator)
MNWHPADELERLLNSLADGLLSKDEEARLADILRGDAVARRRYRHWMTLHAALMWDYAATAADNVATRPGTPGKRSWRMAAAIAAALLLVAGLSLLWLRSQGPHVQAIAWVEEVQGTVSWSNGTGAASVSIEAGMRAPGGTLVLEGEDALAQLRFDDGTLVTLSGESELGFSQDGQKRLALRRGTLNARVQPQPVGRPLLVRTPTAEVEVVGTEFAMSAQSNETQLNVETGSVKLRRLMDGQIVEVNSRQSVVASLTATQLKPAATKAASLQWRQTFDQAPPPAKQGSWLRAGNGLPGRMRATAYVAGRRKDGTTVIHHGVGVDPPTVGPGGFVTLGKESVVRVRYRMERAALLVCFLSCQRTETGFAGNFLLLHPVPKTPADAGGWRVATLPVAAAQAIPTEKYPSPVGTQLRMLIIQTFEQDVGLEVAEVEIAPRTELEHKALSDLPR